MKIARLNALDVVVKGKDIISLIKEGDVIHLVRFKSDLEDINKLADFRGSRAFLLKVCEEKFLMSVDNTLVFMKENGFQNTVLRASGSENFFWHAAEAEGYTFIQEYGHSPTHIYVSEDLESWRKVVSNVDLDKKSKHFHYIAWDPYRRWLVATLGDGCLNRAIYSEDLGKSWKLLYRGAWQFVPIVPLKDEIVFGMDSGIAKGGISIYYPPREKWEFIFLKWFNKHVRLAQMVDLKRLSNGIWIAALGTPQVVLVSNDLRNWHPLHIESVSDSFNFHMKVGEGSDVVACSTGNSLLVFDKDELQSAFDKELVMSSYKAYTDGLRGISFILKRRIIS